MISYEFTGLSLSFIPKHIHQYWEDGDFKCNTESSKKKKGPTTLDIKGGCTTILCKQHRTDSDCLCYCGKRDPDVPMVYCDYCEIWFHFTCVGVDQTIANSKDIYICPMCTKWIEHTKQLQLPDQNNEQSLIPVIQHMKPTLPQVLLVLNYWYKRQMQAMNKMVTNTLLKLQITDLVCLPIKLTNHAKDLLDKVAKVFAKDGLVDSQITQGMTSEQIAETLKEYECDVKVL